MVPGEGGEGGLLAAVPARRSRGSRQLDPDFPIYNVAVLFAELLLNVGRPDNLIDEYQPEGEGGFRGVGEHSAEVQLYLPGSLGWDDEL